MSALLLEIFSEEIPARMQQAASEHLGKALTDALKGAGLSFSAPTSYVTPRRLAIALDDIPAAQPDVSAEKKGPKTSAPQPAIDGFLRSTGLPLEKLEKRMVGKDETYFAVIHSKGRPTAEVLKEIIERILADFPWPKSMRWGSGETRWVRPLHSILCLFDGKTVPVEFAGITAGNVTYGHRFLSPAAITIADPKEYAAKLKGAHVLADATERKAEILKNAEALAAKEGLTLKRDDGLLNEVTGLVEWPVLLMGRIDEKYMDLPPEVLVSEMRAHQKYFALLTKEGAMSDRFLITANMTTKDNGKAVIAGNERVLRARLSDGRFFWDQDRKKPLSEWAKGLEGVTFHAKIGTIAQKAGQIYELAMKLLQNVPGLQNPNIAFQQMNQIREAAHLCKADLVTGMVGEFPELQGVMGRYYAINEGKDPAIADAIREHYLPLGPDSPVPTKNKPISVCIALADKMSTLIEMFKAGEKPTGSKDPFALRRAALGIIRIIRENELRLSLRHYLNEELITFFFDRLKVQLKDEGIRHDIITAVTTHGSDDILLIVEKAKVLQNFIFSPDGSNLLSAYRRANNIVIAEEKKDKSQYDGKVKAELIQQEEEKNLFEKLNATVSPLRTHLREEKFDLAVSLLATLRIAVDAFFEKILVNSDNNELRINRLNLLTQIRDTLNIIADFGLIEG